MAATAEKIIEQIDLLPKSEKLRIVAHVNSSLRENARPNQEERSKAVDEFLDVMSQVELPTEEDWKDDPRLEYLMKKHAK